jgi:hypothetical protein
MAKSFRARRKSASLKQTYIEPITCPHCGGQASLMRRTLHPKIKGEILTFSRCLRVASASALLHAAVRTTIELPPTRTSTSAAPACFAARMTRATSAWVMPAARRGIRRHLES